MIWIQREIQSKPFPRGFHLITHEVYPAIAEISEVKVGVLHIFIRHTSASITLNENTDVAVREDFENYFLDTVPESRNYRHHDEGPDDMPAHIKASLLGFSLQIPIRDGKLLLGTWQGIYLGEHRYNASGRRIVLTLNGK